MNRQFVRDLNISITKLLMLIVLLSVVGCAPSIQRVGYIEIQTKESPNCDVSILKQDESQNIKGIEIGSIRIKDSGFSVSCGEREVISILKKEACTQGANFVYITSETMPSMFGSSCYQVSADLYKLDSTSSNVASKMNGDPEDTPNYEKNDSNPILTVVGFIGGFVIGYALVTILLN